MMLEKIKTYSYAQHLRQLRDVRVVGLLVFAFVILLVTWSGIGVVQTNYELQKKISGLEQEVAVQRLENSNLTLRNDYFETDQYLELQARRQFGKAANGEKLLIVPRQVALSHSVAPAVDDQPAETASSETDKPFYQKNFEAWTSFLFRRDQ